MINPYEKCPVFENENYLLRFVEPEDASDLLGVYSDEKAQPIFNSDNCVDDFHYTTAERMLKAIEFWRAEYALGYYVRQTIIDKNVSSAIGTVEIFNRQSHDYFNNCGLLRLDLRSDRERADVIGGILSLMIEHAFELFGCDMIATKIPSFAVERKSAAEKAGFVLSDEKLIGGDGREYTDYYVLHK